MHHEAQTKLDWEELALNPAVRRLTAILREPYGLFAALVSDTGAAVRLGTELGITQDLLFGEYLDGIVQWTVEEGRSSFEANAERMWRAVCERGEAGMREAVFEERFDVGFEARLYPIRLPDGACAGLVLVGGHVTSEDAGRALERIRRHVPQTHAERMGEEGALRVPQLGREERRFVDTLGMHLAAEVAAGIERQGRRGPRQWGGAQVFAGMIGASDRMRRLYTMIEKVARTNSTVLIEGENGTGKELVARAVHDLSRRRDAPYIAVNCAAIPSDLIASELFGHVRGAFSGAHRERTGLFEAAHRGTLLLDEIGDMDLSLQVKLLRVLQEGTFLRVGDSEPRRVDVRVICATNRDLKKMVAEGTFREDLFYRIKVISLPVPALRERATDIPLLAAHFVVRAARLHGCDAKQFSEACLEQMMGYRWPGNVRELENEIERMVIMSGDQATIGAELLSPRITNRPDDTFLPSLGAMKLPDAVELLERHMILESLRKTGWNKTRSARDLGVSRRNLIRKVANYGLDEREVSS